MICNDRLPSLPVLPIATFVTFGISIVLNG